MNAVPMAADILFTPDKYQMFKRTMQRAEEQGNPTFFFEGQEVLVAQAKYVVEHLAGQFEPRRVGGQ